MDAVGGIYGELGWLYRPEGANKFIASQARVERAIAKTEAALARLTPLLEGVDAASTSTGKAAEKAFTSVALNATKAQKSIDRLGLASDALRGKVSEASQRVQTFTRRTEAAATAVKNNAAALRTQTTQVGRATSATTRLTGAQDKLSTSSTGAREALERLATGARAVQGRLDDLGVHAQSLSTRVQAGVAAIDDQTLALRALQTQAERTTAAMGQLTTAQGGATGAAGRSAAGSELAGAAGAVVAPVAKAAKLAAGVGALVTGAALWQGMNAEEIEAQLKAVSDEARKSDAVFGRMKDTITSLSQTTKYGPSEVAGALLDLTKAGYNADDALAALPGSLNLAAASGEELANTTAVQTAVLKQFGMQAGEAGHVADVLAFVANKTAADVTGLGDGLRYVGPQAANANQSFEDTAAALGVLADAGIHGSQAGTVLRAGLQRLQAPTKQVRDHFEHFGVTLGDIYEKGGKGGLKPMAEILGVLHSKLKDATPAVRDSALSFIFGREALSGMTQLMGQSGDKMIKLGQDAKTAGGYADGVAKVAQHNTKTAWTKVWTAMESAGTKAIERLSPKLQELAKQAQGAVNGFSAGLFNEDDAKDSPGGRRQTRAERVGGRVRGALSRVGRAASGFSAGFSGRAQRASSPGGHEKTGSEQLGAVAGKAAGLIGKGFGLIGPSISKGVAWIKKLWAALAPARPFLDNVLLPMAKGFIDSFLGALKAVIPFVKIVAGVLGFLGKAAKPLRPIFYLLGVALSFLAGGEVTKGIEMLSKLGRVGKVLGAAWKGVTSIFKVVGKSLGKLFDIFGAPAQFARLTGFVSRVAGLFKGLFTKLMWPWQAFRKVMETFAPGLLNMIIGWANKGIDLINKLIDKIPHIPGLGKPGHIGHIAGVEVQKAAAGAHVTGKPSDGGVVGPGAGGARLVMTADGKLAYVGEGTKKEELIPHRGGVIVLSREGDKRRNVGNALAYLRDVGVPGYREGGVVGRRSAILKMDRRREAMGEDYTHVERGYQRDGTTTDAERSDLRRRKLAMQQLARREVKAIKGVLPAYDSEIKKERAKSHGGRNYDAEIRAIQREQKRRGVSDVTRPINRSYDGRIATLQTQLRHVDPGFDPASRQAARKRKAEINQQIQNLRQEKKRAVNAAGDKVRAEDRALTKRVDDLRAAQKRQDHQQTDAKDRSERLKSQRDNLAELMKTLGGTIADLKDDRADMAQEAHDSALTKTKWDKAIADRKVEFTRAQNTGADTTALKESQRADLQSKFAELSKRYDKAKTDADRQTIEQAMEDTQGELDTIKDDSSGSGSTIAEQTNTAAAMRLDWMRTLGSPTVITRLGAVQSPLAPATSAPGSGGSGGRQIVQHITAPIHSVAAINDPFALSSKLKAQGDGWATQAE